MIGSIGGNPTLRGLALAPGTIGPPPASRPNVIPASSLLTLLLFAFGVLGLAGFAIRRHS